jgi:hypothetical protein
VVREVVKGERPDAAVAAAAIKQRVAECAAELGPVTEVVWSPKAK